jgi:putative CocE/NonD family hydrolase
MTTDVTIPAALLTALTSPGIATPARHDPAEIACRTEFVVMRDGTRLATDIYAPPTLPAPAIAVRTPYNRKADNWAGLALTLARRGFVVLLQDVRGTGGSEPDSWDYYIYEPEDGYDFVEWISRQDWFGGFLGSCGESYLGQTQWHMAMHPAMSAIIPAVSGLGIAANTMHLHMMMNAYARTVGKGADKVAMSFDQLERHMIDETLATGFFNQPLHQPIPAMVLDMMPELAGMTPKQAQSRLWAHYCGLTCAERAAFIRHVRDVDAITSVDVEAMSDLFGPTRPHDAHTLPTTDLDALTAELQAPALLRTGWYDWGLNDTLATWDLLQRSARPDIRARSRMLIAPSAHNAVGYKEGMATTPELRHAYRSDMTPELLMQWYDSVAQGRTDEWPAILYYLMGANEWRAASAWPLPDTSMTPLYLAEQGGLSTAAPDKDGGQDSYVYDPLDPAPTVGGSIISYVYPPGSVDVAPVQQRTDILTYTTDALSQDLDVVGPLRMVLFASSDARDTDFVVRLSDVFPDGRAIQLQNGTLRTRYRDLDGEPEWLEAGRAYRLEIDMWATANRFKAGHRLRVDIASSDFPKLDRNSNLAGEDGEPRKAVQTIFRDADRASHIILPILGSDQALAGPQG